MKLNNAEPNIISLQTSHMNYNHSPGKQQVKCVTQVMMSNTI